MTKSLSRPPIKEAILEVVFDPPGHVTLERLQQYGQSIISVYPKKENLVQISGKMQGTDIRASVSRSIIGIQHRSADNNIAIQTRLNGFSYSFLNQTYSVFEIFIEKAFQALLHFFEFAKPEIIKRYSLRFINEIKIPKNAELRDYVLVSPNLTLIDRPLSKYVLRSEFFDDKIQAIGVLTQLLQIEATDSVNVYLDIDVIINRTEGVKGIDLDFLRSEFEKLRKFKNDIFFACLSELAIKTYE